MAKLGGVCYNYGMENLNKTKIKLVKLLEILRRFSDEENPLTTTDLINKLKEGGIACDRRTIYADIKTLNEHGFEVISIKSKGKPTGYYIEDRSFDLPELRILMDAVLSASFITQKKTTVLLDKIADLAGSNRGELLINNVIEFNTTKHTNEVIFYNINEIEEAIIKGKKIGFRYFDYDENLERVFRRGGKKYYVNPISMVYTQDNYYLVCYDDFHPNINHYRIDRMTDVFMTRHDINRIKEFEDFNLKKHHRQVFSMFAGYEEKVTFLIDNGLIDAVCDKFGEKIKLKKVGDKLEFVETVQISPQFFAWVCAFGDKMKVTAPNDVVEKVKDYAKTLYTMYLNDD